MGRLFGTDGVRGVANADLTPELAQNLGRALVALLREEGTARPQVVVGRDPRVSGEMLEAALCAGICSAGGDAHLLGVVPTPAVAYLTVARGMASGAMISASHNPMPDNGIKFFGAGGYKLTDAEEDRITALVSDPPPQRPTGAAVGRITKEPEAVEDYIRHLVSSADADLSGLSVVVDCANGAAATVAPELLRRLGCTVTAIHAEPTGDNINEGCGSTHPEVVARAVVAVGADVGLAHDGDADRLIAADHNGEIVDGDAILAILADRLHRAQGLRTVVTTVMTNLGFKLAMQRLGIEVVETKVGDRYVLEAMRAGGHRLGGEQSGHLIFSDLATTGDGLLTAVRLLSSVAAERRPLADLATVMARLPQVLVNVSGVDRERLPDARGLWEAVRAAEVALGDRGRVLVRASGTEAVVRVMVEASSQDDAARIADELAGVARAELRTRAALT